MVVLRSLLTEDYSDGTLRCELALTDTTCFQPIEILLPIERYHGPKHPDMPDFPPVDKDVIPPCCHLVQSDGFGCTVFQFNFKQ